MDKIKLQIKKIFDKIKTTFVRVKEYIKHIKIYTVERVCLVAFVCIFLFSTIFMIKLLSAIILQEDAKSLDVYNPVIPTKIYDVNNIEIAEFFSEQRELVDFNELPKDLINAIVSMEDQNFHKHMGIDIMGTIRGSIGNLLTGKRMRGGSTLTQQVSRGVILNSSERSIIRKLKEIWVAFQIERRYSKDEIVTFYFNQIFFGHSVYGVQAASKFYFGKDVRDINLGEAAMIATLPPSPNAYSPINNPNNSMVRHKVVLGRMISRGYIKRDEANEAYANFWSSFRGRIGRRGTTAYSLSLDRAPYVTEYVRRNLVEKYGEKTLKESGLKIYTTIDLEKQEIAQQLLTEALIEQNEFYSKYTKNIDAIYSKDILDKVDMLTLMLGIPYDIGENKLNALIRSEMNSTVSLPLSLMSEVMGFGQVNEIINSAMRENEVELSKQVEGALVSIDPRNGYIVSMVGGSGFTPRNQLNRAVQARRQAGSAFKPFVYAYAIESGKFTVASTLDDAPIGYELDNGRYWVPQNYDGTFKGRISIRDALKNSVNIASVKILDTLKVLPTIEYISPIFNVTNEAMSKRMFNTDLTLALGTGIFTPLELTAGYAVLANKGKEVNPIIIRYVTDRYGRMIDNFEQEQKKEILLRGGAKQIVDPNVAYIISDVLTGVLRGGTATSAMANAKFTRLAAGKTGTSSDWKDAWFVGYTPQLVTGVWLGFDSFEYSLGRDRAAGRIAAPIWGRYMKEALKEETGGWYRQTDQIVHATVCAVSGLNLSKSCIQTKTDIFLYSTLPTETCNICEQNDKDLEEIIRMLNKN